MWIGSIPERTLELQHPNRSELCAVIHSTRTRNAPLVRCATWNMRLRSSRCTQGRSIATSRDDVSDTAPCEASIPGHISNVEDWGLTELPSSSLSRTGSRSNVTSRVKLASALTVCPRKMWYRCFPLQSRIASHCGRIISRRI